MDSGELLDVDAMAVVPEANRTTTGAAVRVELSIDWPKAAAQLRADNMDTAIVTVRLVDDKRLLVTTAATTPLSFTLTGPGKILALANGDPSCHERDRPADLRIGEGMRSAVRSTNHGLARVLIQSTHEAGTITLSAAPATAAAALSSAGGSQVIAGAEISIKSQASV